jgi:hypothetical protein
MAGFGFLLGGALKGYGDSKLEQAKAKREAALEERRWERQMAAAGEERKWRETEGEKDRAFRKSENEITRQEQRERDKRDDRDRKEAALLRQRDKAEMDYITKAGMSPEEAAAKADADYRDRLLALDLPKPKSKEERDALEDGQQYVAPDGQILTKGAGRLPDAVDTTGESPSPPKQGEPGYKDFVNDAPVSPVERGGRLADPRPTQAQKVLSGTDDSPFGARDLPRGSRPPDNELPVDRRYGVAR